LIAIIDYFINHEATYKFYNVASGMRVDLLTLAGIVERISGSKRGIKVVRDGLNREYTADNSRLKSELPDFKFTSLEDGIKKMFEFYSKADDQ
jgi:GDP-L-fucose synthase